MKDKKLNPRYDHDPTGYYERKARKNDEMMPYMMWIAALAFLIIVGRTVWLMIFD